MNSNDLNDIQNDIKLALQDLGDTSNMAIKKLTTAVPSGIYKEKKGKTYGTPVTLAGRVNFQPKVEEMTEIGRKAEVNAVFLFATGELIDKGLMTNGSTNFSEKDVVEYKSRNFDIVTITPSALLGDRFLLYKVEAKEAVSNA